MAAYRRYTARKTIKRKYTAPRRVSTTPAGGARRTYASQQTVGDERQEAVRAYKGRTTPIKTSTTTNRNLPYFNPYRQNKSTPAEQQMAAAATLRANGQINTPKLTTQLGWRSSRNYNINPITGDISPTTLPYNYNQQAGSGVRGGARYSGGLWNPYNLPMYDQPSYGQVESYVINPLVEKPPADALDVISIGGGLYRVVVRTGQSPQGATGVENAYHFTPSPAFALPASWTGAQYLNPYPSLTGNTYAEASGIQGNRPDRSKFLSGNKGVAQGGYDVPNTETTDVLPDETITEYPEYPWDGWGGGGGGGGGTSYYSPYTTYQKGYTARANEPNVRPAFRTPGTAASNYYNNPQTTYPARWQQLLTSWRI